MLLASVVRLEGMRILDLTFTHVGHPLHRGRMTDVESHKGATLASRLTIRFLVVTEERAKGICQQPGWISLNSRCHRWVPFPSVWSFRHFPASTTSAGEIQGDYTHAPRAAMWVNQCRRLGRSVASFAQSSSRRVSTLFFQVRHFIRHA